MQSSVWKGDFFVVPGIFNAFSAMLAKKAGFKAIYLSGSALTSSLGLPDIGLITLTEVANAISNIKAAVDLPLIVDADTGFGGPLSVYRSIKTLEAAGADAIQIEDQKLPKRCGHLDGKEVINPIEMVEKIMAAKKASKNALIIARTDARSIMGLDDALKRAEAYVKAGADIVFPEALESKDEFAKFARKISVPLLANMTEFGKTPYMDAKTFQNLGYKYVIFPVTVFRAGAKAMEKSLKELYEKGTQKDILNELMNRDSQYNTINYSDYQILDRSLHQK
jgi:methylisocitrate lyase